MPIYATSICVKARDAVLGADVVVSRGGSLRAVVNDHLRRSPPRRNDVGTTVLQLSLVDAVMLVQQSRVMMEGALTIVCWVHVEGIVCWARQHA